MKFKDRLKLAINQTGKTQNEIVEILKRIPGGEKFTQQTLSSLLVGRIKSTSYVAHIARVCNVDALWLASGVKPETPVLDSGYGSNEQPQSYSPVIDEQVREVIEYAVTHQLKDYYSKLPASAQIKLVFELYSTAYEDRALLSITKDMQTSTLLKMINS